MKNWLLVVFILLFLKVGIVHAQQKSLDHYLAQGLIRSPLLKEYRNNIASNYIDTQLVKANYKPQVNAISNHLFVPAVNGIGYDEAVTTETHTALLSANKTFVGKKNLYTQYHAIGLQSDSTINTSRISEQDLKRTITTQYITAYGDQQQLLNYIKINNLLREEEAILKKLAQNNIYKQADYLAFLVTYNQQDLQLKQLRIQYQTDFANLNYLCGLFDTSAIETVLAGPSLELKPLPDPSLSVYFYKYAIDSMRLQNDIALVNLSYRPKLSVSGDAGFSTSQLNAIYKNFGFSIGVNLSVPIYDGHKRQLSIRKIELQENTRINYRAFFIAQYNQQIAQYMQQLRSTEGLVHDIREQVKYTEGLITVNRRLMQTGDVKIADYIIAINNYLTAQYLVTQNIISRFQIINQINYWSR
jgi:outer membrane protein TolC